jgi:hypothetical protein
MPFTISFLQLTEAILDKTQLLNTYSCAELQAVILNDSAVANDQIRTGSVLVLLEPTRQADRQDAVLCGSQELQSASTYSGA